ncbi:MAG: hypothetical protein H6613_06865 [Ignavibacteriales bacterium]|nr:hypothetical protein [Ignavibacteriales bacterium]
MLPPFKFLSVKEYNLGELLFPCPSIKATFSQTSATSDATAFSAFVADSTVANLLSTSKP